MASAGRGNENLDHWLSADTLNSRTALRNRTLDTSEDGQNFPTELRMVNPDRMGTESGCELQSYTPTHLHTHPPHIQKHTKTHGSKEGYKNNKGNLIKQ